MEKTLAKTTLQRWFMQLIIDSNIIPTFINKHIHWPPYCFDSQGTTIDYFLNLEIILGMTIGFNSLIALKIRETLF